MNRKPSASPESNNGKMCGCWRFAVVLISARKRSAPTSAASSGFRTFSATFRSCLRSSARYTGGHAPLAELTLDRVAAFEGCVQAGDGIGHGEQDASNSCETARDIKRSGKRIKRSGK